jgi:SAM-dependent methyltransferase
MTNNKDHWYDGWIYDTIIAPNQDKLFAQIKTIIEPESTIIDIGCGTGRLEFILSSKCKSLLGIDLSIRNIDRANLTLLKHPDEKISFRHISFSEIFTTGNTHFDYAILTYVVHEINENERIKLLNETAKIADRIIIGDYLVPKPKGFGAYISEAIEFIAGRDHYRNYRSYVSNGGIYSLAEKAGLKVIQEISNHPLSNYIVVMEK